MNLFTEIENAMGEIKDGWCSVQKGLALAAAVIALRPKIVVEIGTYAGRSFIPMVMALKYNGSGLAIGIDPYSPQTSSENETDANAEWWRKLDHVAIMDKFISSIERNEVQNYCKIMRQKSDDVELPHQIDILHIDGSHTEQAVRDVERFASKVRIGGLVFCDDISWAEDGVKKSLEKLIELGFEQHYYVTGKEESTGLMNDWACLQRIK